MEIVIVQRAHKNNEDFEFTLLETYSFVSPFSSAGIFPISLSLQIE